ncbi:hypothetical protein [Streptomyces sp. NBC_01530]|uniref:hypothetical protein n=1 Tax=Streptomyces sp. NBC_01530 TaxID=2903895 RepID=UPI003865923E
MYDLPEPPATTGQADRNTVINQRADQLLAALNGAIEREKQTPTSVRVDDPTIPSFKDGPRVGDTPPVDQPGRPAMSGKATDASAMMIAGGFLSLCIGGAVSMVMYFSGKADPTVIISLCAGPPATFIALKSLIKGAHRAAMPEVHNHHYNGPVQQRNSTTNTRAVWSKTINKH